MAAKAALETELGQREDETDTLKTYQDKLKALDPILTETVITQAIVDDWKTHNNFKTAETMSQEIAKVIENGTLKADFKQMLVKADSEITDLAKLFQKKSAKEIITLIRR
jgi:hypothetical protein